MAVEIADRPGLWRRAGQTGTPCGLDWGPATALIPPHADRGRVLAALRAFETGLVEGAAETAKRQMDEAKRRT